jgi:alpha-beta hydrolase superfamily lysophospholipase
LESAAGRFAQEEVSFTADGLRLAGTLHLPDAVRPPVVVGCHGLLSDRRSPKQLALAEACNALGLAYFRFDHRGCGESQGRLEEVTSLEARTSDLAHAVRMLAARADIDKPFGLFGSSMGGAVCLRAAAQLEIAALVTFAAPVRSRPLTVARAAPGLHPARTRMADVIRTPFDLAPLLHRVRNLLVFHGDADDVVPVAHALEIHDCAAEPRRLVILKDGDHFMSDRRHQQEFIREAASWLAGALTRL